MKEDILRQKIRRELSNLPIDTEPRAMYLLVEIRKVLEHENVKGGILRFYCDWVVHTKLDRFGAQEIYDKINSENTESSQIISFNKLKNELKKFLKDRDLQTDLTDKSNFWKTFKEKLIDILVDTPIEKIDKVIAGSFFYRKENTSGIHFCFKDKDGAIRSLGRIIEE